MIVPQFTFDADANGFLSEPFEVTGTATVHMELNALAPVVTLRREDDGGYANYGQSPEESDRYEFTIHCKHRETLILATPVGVKKCYILN